MKLNLNTGLSALPKIGAGTGPAPWPNTKSTDFDGVDDYITTSTLSSLVDNKSKLSISLWLKLPDAGELNRITGKYAGLSKWLAISCNVDQVIFVVSGLGTAPSESLAYGQTGAVLTDNTWHHIVCVFDGTQGVNNDRGKIYVDNTDEALTYNNSFPSTTYDFSTEGSPPNWDLARAGLIPTSNELRGNMDEYAIYSGVALTSTMVGEIFNSGTPANLNSLATTPNPDLWYRMGDSAVFNADSQWEFPEQTKINNWSSHSFELDGTDDYVDCGTGLNSYFDLADSFSFSAWFKFDSSGNQTIISNMESTTLGVQFRVTSADRVRLIVAANVSNWIARDSSVLSTGTWYHACVTYDGSNTATGINVYIDGTLDNDVDNTYGTRSSITSTQALTIGKKATSTEFFDGSIDSVSIWNAELTSGNVTSIYADGVPNDVSDLGISGLVAYYRMGEGADWNNTNWQVPDYSKNALFSQQSFEFDGCDQYIDAPIPELNSATTVTLSAWIKKPGSGDDLLFGDASPSSGYNIGIWLQWYSNNIVYFAVRNSDTKSATYTLTHDTEWHHFMGVYDGGANTAKLYVDGILRDTETGITSALSADTGDGFMIGGLITSGADYYGVGNIDSVSIWDEALTAGNVTSIYNSGVPNDISGLGISGLIGWWKMGESSSFAGGNWTIPDASTNSNDGTSANMDEVDKKYISPGNEARGESSGMNEADNINNAPDNENQGLSVGMILGSVVEETP